jgi:hypothetical protein
MSRLVRLIATCGCRHGDRRRPLRVGKLHQIVWFLWVHSYKKAPDPVKDRGLLLKAGSDLLSRGSSIIGLAGLTAVFGMGTGVTLPVWPPTKVRRSGKGPADCFDPSEVRGSGALMLSATFVKHRSWCLSSVVSSHGSAVSCFLRRAIVQAAHFLAPNPCPLTP